MKMWMIGFLLGVLLVILIAVIVFTVRKSQSKETYDERQRTARGEAGKIGFVAAMVGFLILFMIELFAAEKGLNINLLFPIAVIAFVSLGIFGCVCIWKDAWITLYQNPKKTLIYSALICFSNYLLAALNYYNYCFSYEYGSAIDKKSLLKMLVGFPFESKIPDLSATNLFAPFINAMCATVMLVLIINYLLKLSSDKSKEKREMNEES